MLAQQPSPDFDVPGQDEPGELPELVADVGLVEVASATREAARVDGSYGMIANTVAAKRCVRASRFGVTPMSFLNRRAAYSAGSMSVPRGCGTVPRG